MKNTICPSLFSDLMSYWAVGADVLLFKRYGFMDFLSVCWISAVTRRSTLSEQGSGDGTSLSRPACKYSAHSFPPTPYISLTICSKVSVDFSRPHFHPNFSCNNNIPNNNPNPSMPCCSITVFRRMGLGADMAGREGAVGVWWNELSWRVWRGGLGAERDCFLLPWKRLQMKRQAQQQWVNPK